MIPLTAEIFERSGIPLDCLEGFCSTFGRDFYKVPNEEEGDQVTLRRVVEGRMVERVWSFEKDGEGEEYVIPFLAGEKIGWEIVEK